ncbi:MAG: hypothetical protein Kow0081_1460 [Candidatus Dojkabacteria bacterium]
MNFEGFSRTHEDSTPQNKKAPEDMEVQRGPNFDLDTEIEAINSVLRNIDPRVSEGDKITTAYEKAALDFKDLIDLISERILKIAKENPEALLQVNRLEKVGLGNLVSIDESGARTINWSKWEKEILDNNREVYFLVSLFKKYLDGGIKRLTSDELKKLDNLPDGYKNYRGIDQGKLKQFINEYEKQKLENLKKQEPGQQSKQVPARYLARFDSMLEREIWVDIGNVLDKFRGDEKGNIEDFMSSIINIMSRLNEVINSSTDTPGQTKSTFSLTNKELRDLTYLRSLLIDIMDAETTEEEDKEEITTLFVDLGILYTIPWAIKTYFNQDDNAMSNQKTMEGQISNVKEKI